MQIRDALDDLLVNSDFSDRAPVDLVLVSKAWLQRPKLSLWLYLLGFNVAPVVHYRSEDQRTDRHFEVYGIYTTLPECDEIHASSGRRWERYIRSMVLAPRKFSWKNLTPFLTSAALPQSVVVLSRYLDEYGIKYPQDWYPIDDNIKVIFLIASSLAVIGSVHTVCVSSWLGWTVCFLLQIGVAFLPLQKFNWLKSLRRDAVDVGLPFLYGSFGCALLRTILIMGDLA